MRTRRSPEPSHGWLNHYLDCITTGTDYKTLSYEGLIRSHFGVDEAGRLAEVAHKVKPLTTADLAIKLVKL